MADMKALARDLHAKREEMKDFFSKNKVDGELKLTTEQIVEVNQRETELKGLQEKYVEAKSLFEIEQKNEQELAGLTAPGARPQFGGSKSAAREISSKSIGEQFIESAAYKSINGRKGPTSEIEGADYKALLTGLDYKTVMQDNQSSGAGYAPQSVRSGRLVYSPQPQPTLIDLVPTGETDQSVYKYMEETVYTNAAAETAEAALSPEAALKYDERSVNVVKIPVFIPITEEQLADVGGLRDTVDNRLGLMIKQRLNGQIVVGDGTGSNMLGLLNKPNILTQNKGTDVVPDCIYKAMVKVMTQGFADPSGIWMNPLDWQNVRLLKTTTGQYLYGDPSQQGPNTIFGLPVAQHVNVTLGNAPVVDFATYTSLIFRNGIEFSVSDSHADFFARGQLAIRAMIRAAWVMYRAQAICVAQGL
ncbi:phage capsid protein [Capsulimonas corticalis]|uniref:Phage capsid protein n=1 Tax=Capsulimonas corticalis TaxID=2219043 RepID=A0A402CZI0_9BACT|nr:phage major capsid protein [Capsulimonas corticalis]BDI29408.1 phage capsid protein [Capsulimonas corticalis]